MRRDRRNWLLLALLLTPNIQAEEPAKPSPADVEFFESKVRPVLVERCFNCHGPDKQKGGLRLDSPKAMRAGGDSGPAIVAGKIDESLLIEAIRYTKDIQMPPKGKMPETEIALLTDWVKRGAPWPEVNVPVSTEASATGKVITDDDRAFWSFQPVKNHQAPAVSNPAWPQGDLDRFILSNLEDKGLIPADPADKRTLIRRASFDLIGLPPTPEEVDSFLKDESKDAFSKVVERLLASPHYGERWGRHWLDIARYGEDQAHTFEARIYPQGYRYRDWVIAALNQDMPYDRFVIEQIAADLLDEPGVKDRLPALGFFALGPVYYGDPKKFDQYDDRIDTMSRGFLGLTVACARCHDHKFDPIPTSDYYALAGIFASTNYHEEPAATLEEVEAFKKGQAEVKARQTAVDEYLKTETRRLNEGRSNALNAYLVAAWTARNQTNDEAKELAKLRGLEFNMLKNWIDLIQSGGKDRPQIAGWLKRFGTVETQLIADEFQNWVKTLIILQASPAKLEPAEKDLLNELFGDKGLVAYPKNAVEPLLAAATKTKLGDLRKELNQVKKNAPAMYPVMHSLKDADKPSEMQVLVRGNPDAPGAKVSRHFLSILDGDKSEFAHGSGRLELAKAIASKDNPLTARVIVNRVWQWHFGRGLVPTPSNFGFLGERPTHPELLDYLTAQFIADGWSLKKLHRAIMLSATYQQANGSNAKAEQVDPENRLLWKMGRKRLEVEAWRDAMLAVSGRLESTLGGPSLKLDAPENRRRTVYAKVSRHDLAPLLRGFDFPDPNITSAERTRTTVALQGLTLLNSEFLIENAKSLVAKLDGEPDDEAKIRRAYDLLFCRPVQSDELRVALAYLKASDPEDAPKPDLTRWQRYAQALLSTNEFAFVD